MNEDFIAYETYQIKESELGQVLYDDNEIPVCNLGNENPGNELLGFFLLNNYICKE